MSKNGFRVLGPLALTLASVLVQSVPAATAPWGGQEILDEDRLRMANPDTPIHPPGSVALAELWRVGGDSEEEGEFFGVIADLAVDTQGNVYLLDRQLSEVRVFDAEGGYLQSIGREGEGPGEFRSPAGLFFMPDGRLAVVQRRPAGLVLLHPEGLPAGRFDFQGDEDGFRSITSGRSRGDHMVLLGNGFKFTEEKMERSRELFAVNAEGRRTHDYAATVYEGERGRRVIDEVQGFEFPWALGPDGRVYACTGFDFEIEVRSSTGEIDRLITRDYEPYRRSADEKAAVAKRLRGRTGRHRRQVESEIKVSETEPAIRWLDVDEQGYLWVLTGRSRLASAKGAPPSFEIYDPAGRFCQVLDLEGEIDLAEDRIVRHADRLYVLRYYVSALDAMLGRETEEDEDDYEEAEPMSVICYRLDWIPPSSP